MNFDIETLDSNVKDMIMSYESFDNYVKEELDQNEELYARLK